MITELHRLSDPLAKSPGPAWAAETKVIPIIKGPLSDMVLPVDGQTHEVYLTTDESTFTRVLAKLRSL